MPANLPYMSNPFWNNCTSHRPKLLLFMRITRVHFSLPRLVVPPNIPGILTFVILPYRIGLSMVFLSCHKS